MYTHACNHTHMQTKLFKCNANPIHFKYKNLTRRAYIFVQAIRIDLVTASVQMIRVTVVLGLWYCWRPIWLPLRLDHVHW